MSKSFIIAGMYDLFICYNTQDSEKFVTNIMLPTLENDYGYKCFVVDRNTSAGECKKYKNLNDTKN